MNYRIPLLVIHDDFSEQYYVYPMSITYYPDSKTILKNAWSILDKHIYELYQMEHYDI